MGELRQDKILADGLVSPFARLAAILSLLKSTRCDGNHIRFVIPKAAPVDRSVYFGSTVECDRRGTGVNNRRQTGSEIRSAPEGRSAYELGKNQTLRQPAGSSRVARLVRLGPQKPAQIHRFPGPIRRFVNRRPATRSRCVYSFTW